MSVEAVAGKWHDQFLRTDPIAHEKAEAALRDAYRAAGIAEPSHFLWCSSPAEAAWAYLVLVGKTEGYSHAVYQDVERSKGGKEALAQASASVAEKLGIGADEVEGYFGKPFYVAEGSNPISRKLQENFDAWMARAEAGDDFLAIHKQGPFKPLHDLEQVLHFEGERGGRGSLFKEALARSTNKHLAILGGRSALHRLYGSFAYSEVALDEALAGLARFEPTELQRAMWAAYEATGMWWPCQKGVVLAERPVAAERSGGDVGLQWADGFSVGEVSAQQPAVAHAAAPVAEAPRPSADAAILYQPLAAGHAERIAQLRAAAPLPLLDRYVAGEHEPVWEELIGLGEKVRTEAHAADALAVAYETMHRVEQNVRTLAERLKAMGYRFVYPGSGGFLGLRKPAAHEPHLPPPAAAAGIAELEELAGGALPLSLRAFFEVVGEVNFNGDHPSLAPADSAIAPDPLMVCGLEEAIAMVESSDRDDDDDRVLIDFAPDALHKANVSGGDPYAIEVPGPVADAKVEGAPRDVHFVEYLRSAILDWGGFPGWKGGDPPPEVERLREGLIPF